MALSKTKDASSVIFEPFQGKVEVTSLTKKLVDHYSELQSSTQEDKEVVDDHGWVRKVSVSPFNFLSLDIPACPLFRDSHGGLVIPQVPLYQLLQKFDGESWTDTVTKEAHVRRQYRLITLPAFLVVHLVRFTKNNFTLEKNPTIVTFPVRNLEMKDFLHVQGEASPMYSTQELLDMTAEQLQQFIVKCGSELHRLELQALEPSLNQSSGREQLRLIAQRVQERVSLFHSTKYDLVGNICHVSDGSNNRGVDIGDISTVAYAAKIKTKAANGGAASGKRNGGEESAVLEQGGYKVHLQCKAANQWYELQDLHATETTPQQIGVSESYILIYEKKTTPS